MATNNCTPCQQPIPLVVQGDDKVLNFYLINQLNGLPFNISTASEIVASFNKVNGTSLLKTLTGGGIIITNGGAGIFQVILTPSDTSQMALGYGDGYQSITIKITIATKITILNFSNAIQVEPPAVPLS